MIEVIRKYKGIIIGILFTTAGMLFFLIMQVFNLWGNPPAAGPTGFCEYYDPDRLVGETMNSWSCFYYVAVGMLLIAYYDLIGMDKIKGNDKYITREENRHYILTYGLLVIWVGVASFYMHGSYRSNEWISGGFLDVLSMNMYMSSLIIMSLAILFDLKKRNFYIIFLIDIILIIFLMKSDLRLPSLGGGGLFEFFLIFAFINEIFISLGAYSKVFKNKGARQIRRYILLLIFILISFLVEFWVWHFGKRGEPTCDPYSWWQWHAVWHFGNAFSMALIALYMLTEREIQLDQIIKVKETNEKEIKT